MSAVATAVGGAALIGGVTGAVISSNATGDAAQKQVDAANRAAQLQYQEFEQQLENAKPWRDAGKSALYGPGGLLVPIPGSGATTPMDQEAWIKNDLGNIEKGWSDDQKNGKVMSSLGDTTWDQWAQEKAQSDWNATGKQQQDANANQFEINPELTRGFTQQDFYNNMDPAYQFDLQQGQQALERSAAAHGSLKSGGTLKDLSNYSQGMASNEYANAYNRFITNQTNQFNRLSSVAGLGQVASGQISQAGMNMANNASNIITGAGNAQAAAQIAQGNTWGKTLSGLGQMPLAYSILNRNNPTQQPNPGIPSIPSGGYGAPGGGYGLDYGQNAGAVSSPEFFGLSG